MRTRKKPNKRSLIKKLQNGGTGDPKKPTPGAIPNLGTIPVSESTAVPNFSEQAFLNYAGLMPSLEIPSQPGVIRPTPERKASLKDQPFEGTPIGRTRKGSTILQL